VDAFVCRIVERLRSLRAQQAGATDGFLLPRTRCRQTLIRGIRKTFRDAVAAAGITTRLVPHQNRHTYATEMLRAGVSLPGLMELLGHASPEMTLRYLEITQPDLQREYQLARSHPRHLVPPPRALPASSVARADLISLLNALDGARHVAEMFRRAIPDNRLQRLLARIGNRLTKMLAQLHSLKTAQE
jgi:hypothetical protein